MKTKDEIVRIIEEEDVEFVRLQFTDVFGNLKNIAVTSGQIERILNNQISFEGAAVFDNLAEMDEELYLYPDLNSFAILPWRPQQRKVAKFTCDVCYENGRLFEDSPRTILKRTLALAQMKGYSIEVDPECEFYLFHTDDNGKPTTLSHESAGYLDVGPFDYGENARRDIVLGLEEMGFEVESSYHEQSPAQHEIDFVSGEDSLQTADAIMTFKFAVRSIAKRFGLYATFMPMPGSDCAGSGLHLNFSLKKDGENLFDAQEDGSMTKEAEYFIGGIMSHILGICAITNPIVNSYKRLLQGTRAPKLVDYSYRGETALIKYRRRRGKSKVELRFPDSAANPYLAISVCIAAGLDGIENQIDPSKIMQQEKTLPGTLESAIRHFSKDRVLIDCLGERFAKTYYSVKKQEWNDYMSQVSDWEINRYLNKM